MPLLIYRGSPVIVKQISNNFLGLCRPQIRGCRSAGVPEISVDFFPALRLHFPAMPEKSLNEIPRDLRVMFTKGNDALSRDNFDYAIDLFNQVLLREPGIALFEFEQAEAYSRRFRFLGPVVLPRGVADLVKDIPPRDVRLIAPTTMLVARESTHPALMQLFIQAAHKIHGEPGWIARAGQFPSAQNIELPLAREAERYFRSGPPLLQRYLPFWLANLVDRMWVALLSIIAILIPLGRIVPPLYEFRIRSRIFRWYRHLREIENEIAKGEAPAEDLLAELNKVDARAARITVPLSYTDELYALRSHIDLVRERLRQAK